MSYSQVPKSRGSIYLSGGMEHAKDLGAGWREETSAELTAMGYFPLDITALDVAYQQKHGDMFNCINDNDTYEQALIRKKASIRKHFIKTDLQLILNDSDALVVYYDTSVRMGAGTISECQVAFNNDIPIFVVSSYSGYDDIPGWLLALSTKVFFYFADLYTYMGGLPEGILVRDMYGNHNSGDEYLCSLSGEPFRKDGLHFVSTVSPLYNKESVRIVQDVNRQKDRYEFFMEHINDSVNEDDNQLQE